MNGENLTELEFEDLPELEFEEPIPAPTKPRDLWSLWGAGITPEMERAYPYATAIARTGQEVGAAPLHFLNMLAFNLPRAMARKYGYEYPEPETLPGQFLAKPAGIAGLLTSPITRGVTAIGRVSPAARLATRLLRPAAAGAVGGLTWTPTEAETLLAPRERLAQATLGGTLGLTFGLLRETPRLIRFGGRKTAQRISEKATKGIGEVFDEFDTQYEKLFSRIKEGSTQIDDIAEAVENARLNAVPGSLIEKRMTALGERLEGYNELTAESLQALKQEIRKTLPKNIWSGRTPANTEQHFIKETYKSVNNALARIGGRQYQDLSSEYHNYMVMVEDARSVLLERGRPTDVKLLRELSVPEERALRGISERLPPGEQFWQELVGLRRGEAVKRALPGVGKLGVGIGALGWFLNRLLGRRTTGGTY